MIMYCLRNPSPVIQDVCYEIPTIWNRRCGTTRIISVMRNQYRFILPVLRKNYRHITTLVVRERLKHWKQLNYRLTLLVGKPPKQLRDRPTLLVGKPPRHWKQSLDCQCVFLVTRWKTSIVTQLMTSPLQFRISTAGPKILKSSVSTQKHVGFEIIIIINYFT